MNERKKALANQGGSYAKPATKRIEWASEDKCFRYYHKAEGAEKGENVLIPLPLKFLVLDIYSTIKGWSDSESSGIYANEVKSTGKEMFEVKTFSGKTITRGLYKDVKEVIVNAGGKFTTSIYAMDEQGEIINFQIRGISLKQWMDFTKLGSQRLSDEWVIVDSFKEGKKGRVVFSMPEFKYLSSLSKTDETKADLAFKKLQLALAGRNESRTDEAIEAIEAIEVIDAEELDAEFN
jgi:hypothetical protein